MKDLKLLKAQMVRIRCPNQTQAYWSMSVSQCLKQYHFVSKSNNKNNKVIMNYNFKQPCGLQFGGIFIDLCVFKQINPWYQHLTLVDQMIEKPCLVYQSQIFDTLNLKMTYILVYELCYIMLNLLLVNPTNKYHYPCKLCVMLRFKYLTA